jgi:Toxin SymE, type I toxin-antitoxin system
MATSQSTSQQLSSGKPKACRRLTVGYLASSARHGCPPHIRIMGRWVEEAGFAVGAKVDVDVSHGRLVIELAPPEPESEPTPPPRRAYISERMAMTVVHRLSKADGRAVHGGDAS